MNVCELPHLFWLLFGAVIVPGIRPGPEVVQLITLKSDKIPSRDEQTLLVVCV